MSFLNNFRLQYHIKHIEKIFDEENSIEAISYLRELKRNEELFYKLSLKYISKLINQSNDNVLEKKIIFINSFLDEDLDFCRRFLEYYFQNNQNSFGNISPYLHEIDSILKKDELVDFNTMVNESYFFQWILLNNHNYKTLARHYLMDSCGPSNIWSVHICSLQHYVQKKSASPPLDPKKHRRSQFERRILSIGEL